MLIKSDLKLRKIINKTIAIVLNTTWNIYNFRLGLVKTLINHSYKVVAIAPPDEYVEKIRAIGCKFIPLSYLSRKGANPIKEILLYQELYAIYKREKVDLVLHYTIKPVIYGTLAANQLGIKTINTLTGLGYAFLSKGIINKVVLKLYRFALAKATRVFFQNRDDLALFLKEGLVTENKTGLVHGSGININYFKSNKYPSKEESIDFLFIGRLLYDKGIVEYFNAAKQLAATNPEAQFHIVGAIDQENPSAMAKEILEKWLEEGYLKYHGVVKDTRPLIEKCHVMVLPSYREGLPRVMLEGMAMERPLITTDVPGCRETVIDGANGYLVKVKDSKDLAETMQKMIKKSLADLIKMGKIGRKLACDRFSEQRIISIYLKEIDKLI